MSKELELLKFRQDYLVDSILNKARELGMDERDLEVKGEDGEVMMPMVSMVLGDMLNKFEFTNAKVKSLEEKIKAMAEAAEGMILAVSAFPSSGPVLSAKEELAKSLLGYSSKVPMPEKLEEIEFGDPIPYEEWVECVEASGFIDYDGHGYYGTEDGFDKRLMVLPSHYKKGVNPKPDWATHVIWFNR